jgi:cytochrome c-type biogenesis protein CcsB
MGTDWLAIELQAVSTAFWASVFAMAAFMVALGWRHPLPTWLGRAAMAVATGGGAVTLYARSVVSGHAPWSNLWESMIMVGFVTLLFYWVVELWYRPRHFGALAAPLVLLGIGGASLLPPGFKAAAPLMPALQSYWLKVHVAIILSSYAVFTLSFATACAYLGLHWWERRHTAGPGGLKLATAGGPQVGLDGQVAMAAPEPAAEAKAPALSATLVLEAGASAPQGLARQLAFFDELTYRLILVGFPLLMIGIITGAMWANGAWGTYWSWDPKETWALITWLIYAAYLHARLIHGWQGPKAAGLGVVGFVSMLITYIGVNYLSQGLHSYGFIR